MEVAFWFIPAFGVSIWIFRDCIVRGANPFIWSILALVFSFLVLPIYFGLRPLKPGEIREGSRWGNAIQNMVDLISHG